MQVGDVVFLRVKVAVRERLGIRLDRSPHRIEEAFWPVEIIRPPDSLTINGVGSGAYLVRRLTDNRFMDLSPEQMRESVDGGTA